MPFVHPFKPTVQTVIPTNGQTIQVVLSSHDHTVFLEPAGTLAALIVNINGMVVGDILRICSTQEITSFSATGVGTVLGGITQLAVNETMSLKMVKPNTLIFLS